MNHKDFKVAGAGIIRISESIDWKTGSVKGFSLDVNWGRRDGFSGGVLGRDEARKLAEHILKALDQ